MSNQYYSATRAPGQSGSQIQFVANNVPPSYPLGPGAVLPGQQYVQHVVVPVAVPVQSGDHPQFGQPMPVYSVTEVPGSPPLKKKRTSEELSYYLGKETNRRSRRSPSRSRSRERHSRSARSRSRSSDYDRRRGGGKTEQGYDKVSRSPDSRHSSYRHSESRHSDRHRDSSNNYNRDSRKDYHESSHEYSRESREEYRESSQDYSRDKRKEYRDSSEISKQSRKEVDYRDEKEYKESGDRPSTDIGDKYKSEKEYRDRNPFRDNYKEESVRETIDDKYKREKEFRDKNPFRDNKKGDSVRENVGAKYKSDRVNRDRTSLRDTYKESAERGRDKFSDKYKGDRERRDRDNVRVTYKEHSKREHSADKFKSDRDRDTFRETYRDDSKRERSSDKYKSEREYRDRKPAREAYREESDRFERRSEHVHDENRRSFDKHLDYREDSADRLRKEWSDSKHIIQGKQRRYSEERDDYGETKRRKYEAEYDRGASVERGDRSSYDKELDAYVRDRVRTERVEKYRAEDYDRRDRDRIYDRVSDYDRNYDRGIDDDYDRKRGYDRQSLERVSDSSGEKIKVHVDDRGRWIETDRVRGDSEEPVIQHRSRRDDYDRDNKYKLNITIANERAYRGSSEGRDRPRLYEDDAEIDREPRDRPRLFEDDAEVDVPSRYEEDLEVRRERPVLFEDGSIVSDDGPKLYEDGSEVGNDRPKLYEDDLEVGYDKGRHDEDRYKSGSHRSEFDNISDGDSIVGSSIRSGFSRQRSGPQRDGQDYKPGQALPSRSPPPHALSVSSGSSKNRGPQHPNRRLLVTQDYPPEIPFDVPILCLAYSWKTSCQDPRCPNWHVCRNFVEGKCKFGSGCKRGHDFFMGGICKVLNEFNNMKIDFRQVKNKTHFRYRIIGKLRKQLNERMAQRLRDELPIRPRPKQTIDPEFDAANYDNNGQFIKKTASEITGNQSVSEKSKETDKVASEKGSVDQTEDKSKNVDAKCEKDNTQEASNEDVKKDDSQNKDINDQEKDETGPNQDLDISADIMDEDIQVIDIVDDSGSLSPVSLENIDNWEKFERYERISEDELSDAEDKKEEELENVSSDEEVQKDKFPFNSHNILANAAVPIGMNDPLVFNPSKSVPLPTIPQAGPQAVTQPPPRMSEPQGFVPARHPPPIRHMGPQGMRMNQSPFHNVRHPPPPQQPRAQSLPVPSHPLFPAARAVTGAGLNMGNQPLAMNQPLPAMNQPPPAMNQPQFHVALPTHDMTQPPPNMQALPGQPFTAAPPIHPLNYLPPPSLLQEVIQSLQANQTKAPEAEEKVQKRKSGELDSLVEKNPELNEVIQTPWQFPHKVMLNMSVIDFATETEAYKEEFVAELARILITLDLPYVTMKKLMAVIKEKMTINITTPIDMKKILALYPTNFQLIETLDSDDEDDDAESVRKNVQIKAKLNLGFCERHGYLPFAVGKCDCNALHICRFFFLSTCPKSKCKFGHKLKTDHNMTVFRTHKLHRLTGKEVMMFVRDPDNRHSAMCPEVCNFYNKEKGSCYKGDITDVDTICHKLHLCQYFAKATCYKHPCPKSHYITDIQPHALLRLYGLNPDIVGEERILAMLREVMLEYDKKKASRNAPHHGNKKVGVAQNDNTPVAADDPKTFGSSATAGVLPQESANKPETVVKKERVKKERPRKVRKVNVKLPTVCKFYNNNLGCKKRDWGPTGYCMFVHVCQHYVSGDCKFGDKCKRSHDLIGGPAGQLLQKHGLDTTQYTSGELADILNHPDEAMGTNETKPPQTVVVMDTNNLPVKNAVKTETTVKAEPKPSETTEAVSVESVVKPAPSASDVKVPSTNVASPVKSSGAVNVNPSPASYKSYSVEDILNQIVEKGKEEERRKFEQAVIDKYEQDEEESGSVDQV